MGFEQSKRGKGHLIRKCVPCAEGDSSKGVKTAWEKQVARASSLTLLKEQPFGKDGHLQVTHSPCPDCSSK